MAHISDEVRIHPAFWHMESMDEGTQARALEVLRDVVDSGLLGLTRGASLDSEGSLEWWRDDMICGILGDWYEERGRDAEARSARAGLPLGALQAYLEWRIGVRPNQYSVWALVGFT